MLSLKISMYWLLCVTTQERKVESPFFFFLTLANEAKLWKGGAGGRKDFFFFQAACHSRTFCESLAWAEIKMPL